MTGSSLPNIQLPTISFGWKKKPSSSNISLAESVQPVTSTNTVDGVPVIPPNDSILPSLKNLALGDYQIQPFDVVLFAGNDAVAKMISKVTLHEVVPKLKRPFSRLWTHSGMIVTKEVLPLECLEPGRLYVYESVFSGSIAGVPYSRTLPVDRAPAKAHLGPQIRPLDEVIEEMSCDVVICPLLPSHRQQVQQRLDANPRFLLDIYLKHKDFSYPLGNILKVVAAASDPLYKAGTYASKTFSAVGGVVGIQIAESKSIFCSELVSTVYRGAELPTFVKFNPDQVTPLELEVAEEFGGLVYYVKEAGVVLLHEGKMIPATTRLTRAHLLLASKLHKSDKWIKVDPGKGVPPFQPDGKRTEFAGIDFGGEEMFLARAQVGNSLLIGKIQKSWNNPMISYFDREVSIAYGHEILVSYEGLKWVTAQDGQVPPNALVAGMEEDGTILHVARGELEHKQSIVGLRIGKPEVCLCLGKIGHRGYTGAKMTVDGREVEITKYQVLCLDNPIRTDTVSSSSAIEQIAQLSDRPPDYTPAAEVVMQATVPSIAPLAYVEEKSAVVDEKSTEETEAAESETPPPLLPRPSSEALAASFRKLDLDMGQYEIQPFDLVLFAGKPSDAVANLISKVSLNQVVPKLQRPFSRLWTHSSMIVTKSVLPLDILEDGKLYIYESAFSGTTMGVQFSTVGPLDFPGAKGHLGPQLRLFPAVLNDMNCDVAICPLSPHHRAYMTQLLKQNPNFLLDFYNTHKGYGYPLANGMKIMASVSDPLFKTGDLVHKSFSAVGVPLHVPKTIFCSEMIAKLYREAGLPSFTVMRPGEFSPLELEMCQEFDGRVVYVKENGVSLLRGGRNFVPIRYSPPQDHELVATSPASWIPVRACGGVPEFQENGKRTEFAGISFEGKEMYVARATIGKSLLVGRIEKGMTCPVVAYFDREVRISFGHEILVSYEGLKWVNAKDGDVPANALVAGVEQDGTLLHIARGEVEHNQTVAGLRIGKSEVCLCLGKIGKGYTGAKMTVDGHEVEIKKYQVLCLDV